MTLIIAVIINSPWSWASHQVLQRRIHSESNSQTNPGPAAEQHKKAIHKFWWRWQETSFTAGFHLTFAPDKSTLIIIELACSAAGCWPISWLVIHLNFWWCDTYYDLGWRKAWRALSVFLCTWGQLQDEVYLKSSPPPASAPAKLWCVKHRQVRRALSTWLNLWRLLCWLWYSITSPSTLWLCQTINRSLQVTPTMIDKAIVQVLNYWF